MSASSARPSRPRDVKEIAAEAEDFNLNVNIPLKVWIRSAQMLTQRGDLNLRKGDFAQAYMLYWRYAILMTERLSKHPEYKTPAGREAAKPFVSQLPGILDTLDRIKPLIKREFEEWQAEENKRQELRAKRRAEASQLESSDRHQDVYNVPRRRRYERHEELDLDTHRDLAVELAQKEMRRRERDRESQAGAAVTADQERNRRVAGIWDRWTVELAEEQARDEELFRRQMESTRRRLDGDHEITEGFHKPGLEEASSSQPLQPTNYKYPTISRSEPVRYDPAISQSRKSSVVGPARPPKYELATPSIYRSDGVVTPSLPPPLPTKEALDFQEPLSSAAQQPPVVPPKEYEDAEVSPKPQKTFRPAAYLENGEPLRSIILPRQLRYRFLDVAEDNTRQGLEMCGMLCGTDVNNVLVVSCLIIPEQKCTSDTCETENENALLEYCMAEDLLMIGWIHTHPTQTCFMSSRDLHTHAGYQIMLPESIAIVCAPTKEPDHGIFRLTNPPGLPHILDCTQQATFHQHSVDNLYTSVEIPHGHVLQDDRLHFTLVDLRPGFRDGPGSRKNF